MPDIDLRGLTPRSFEQLIQSLAVKFISLGVDVFGDGPDGGREATYQGAMNYPDTVSAWDGYLVIQAKFRTKLTSDTRDVSWLVSELKSELSKFLDPARGLKAPEYYILATNVVLSSIQSNSPAKRTSKRPSPKGGHEKLEEALAPLLHKVGIRGFDVWHCDKIRSLIDLSPEIRRSYASWITSSEVMFRLLDEWSGKPRDFESIIRRFVAREIKSRRTAGLHQAGHSSEIETFLDQVFVDLPFEVDSDDIFLDDGEYAQTPKIVSFLVERLGEKLDAETVDSHRRRSESGAAREPRPERCLILGGPGQGKSTLSQFLAQILRARWLNSTAQRRRIASEVGMIVEATVSRATSEKIGVNGPLRFPLHISLPNWADTMPSGGTSKVSLLTYATNYINSIADSSLTSDDLRHWLRQHPWAVLLDGLDEVPPTGNRTQIIKEINDFWDEVCNENGDVIVIITTRPQGYNNDLDPNIYSIFDMSLLDTDTAAIMHFPNQRYLGSVTGRDRPVSRTRTA
jgi:hypothetical protein